MSVAENLLAFMSPSRFADTFTPSNPGAFYLHGLQRFGVAQIGLQSYEIRTLLLLCVFPNPLISLDVRMKRSFEPLLLIPPLFGLSAFPKDWTEIF